MKLPSGTYRAQKKDGTVYYRASVTYRTKHISLGSYETPEKAHEAYLEAGRLLGDVSLSAKDYSVNCALRFDKWVVLLNFRDNGIYFATPIYMRQKFFYYYLSQEDVLTFDRDDLFYYASRRILRRGGHLFVADYGMQVNILNRYGIKNYGVQGKDYRFVNGICTDFRYENIEILNGYHGVSVCTKDGKPCYRTKIHIRGAYTVGYYATPEEAAIAYNKAIDILRQKGVQKNFTQNYLETVSPSAYADIYTRVPVSAKIVEYRAP